MQNEQNQKLIDATIESAKEKIKSAIYEIQSARTALGIELKKPSAYTGYSWDDGRDEYDSTFIGLQGLVSDLAETMGDPVTQWQSSAC